MNLPECNFLKVHVFSRDIGHIVTNTYHSQTSALGYIGQINAQP